MRTSANIARDYGYIEGAMSSLDPYDPYMPEKKQALIEARRQVPMQYNLGHAALGFSRR